MLLIAYKTNNMNTEDSVQSEDKLTLSFTLKTLYRDNNITTEDSL